MAILFTNPLDGLEHTSGVLPFDADFTWMGWFTPVTNNASGGDYRNYWVLHDVDYTNYIEIASDADFGDINLYGYDGSNFTSKFTIENVALLDNAYHVCVTYDISATTLKYYINGSLYWTYVSADFTGITSTNEYIGYDVFSGLTNLAVQNSRAWTSVLTADEIALEISSNTAVKSSTLFYDTPLTDASDLADVSGNAKNWVNIDNPGDDYLLNDVKFITGSANNSFGTALTIPYLPYKLVQNAKLVSTATDLYYSFNAIAANNVIGAWGYSPNATYNPTLKPYFSDETSILSITGERKPIQFPVDGGSSYYLKSQAAGGNPTTAINFLQIDYIGTEASASGDLADPDDTEGFPLALIRQDDIEVYQNIITFKHPFPSCEQADILESGIIAVANEDDPNTPIDIFNTSLNEIASITTLTTQLKFVRTQNEQDLFYVVTAGLGSDNSIAFTVNDSGIIGGTSWDLGGTSIGTPGSSGGICANNDGTILYYSKNNAIARWDLTNNIALADFLPAVTNYKICDILVQSDDSILIGYFKDSITRDLFVRRYNAAGTLLDTYNFGSDHRDTTPRLCYSINDPATFWVWVHILSSPGLCNFIEITISDGSEATNIPAIEFEGGTSQEDVTPIPRSRYGLSFSCPFFQLRESFVPPVNNPLSGIYKIIPWSAKQNDTLYTSLDPVETVDVKIPDPTATTGLFGE